MDQPTIITVLTTLTTVLGSTAAWNYYEKRLLVKQKEDSQRERERSEYKDDLRERVAVMESKLQKSEEDKKTLQEEVLRLVEKIAALSVEVEFLRKENGELKSKSQNG
jgi:peptidoglycan hydrolase CwlO-like protein